MPTKEGDTRPGTAHTVGEVRRPDGRPVGRMVPLARIEPDPDQPRRELGSLDGLTASIRARGVLEPILARPIDQVGPTGGPTAGTGSSPVNGVSAPRGGPDSGRFR